MRFNFFIGLAVVALLFFAGCQLKEPTINDSVSQPVDLNNNETKKIEAKDLEKEYERLLPQIMQPFWEQKDISGIKERVIALTAPQKYLDLHLNLVIALENIEQGRKTADQEKIESGLDKINELVENYPWLRK